MTLRTRLARAIAAVAFAGVSLPAHAQTEIQWWHSMTGALNDRVNEFAKGFNESQKDYKVVPVYKGAYPESMAAAIAAFRAGNAPHILQVFEVGTATMMGAKGAIKPVQQVMARGRREVRSEGVHPAVAGYYTTQQGPDAVVPVQQLDDGVLLQQGHVREGRPRPEPRAGDLARGHGRRGEDQDVRHVAVRLHDRLAVVGARRELPRVAQRADRAPRRTAWPASTRRSSSTGRCTCGTGPTCKEWADKGYFTYGGRTQRGRGEVLQRRVRDADVVVGRAGEHQPQREVQVRRGDPAVLRGRRRARRRTRSSAARRCG